MEKYVLLGGLGRSSDFGGEVTKNRNIIAAIENKFQHTVRTIDVYNSRKSPIKLIIVAIKFIYYCFLTNRTIIFSTTYGNITLFLKLIVFFNIKNKLIYWVIGSKLGNDIEEGKYHIKYLKRFKKIIVEFDKTKEQLTACGLSNVSIASNFKVINYIPSINKYDDNLIHFVFISRIMPEKGVDYILRCCEKLNITGYKEKYCVDFYGVPDSEYENYFLNRINNFENLKYKGGLQLNVAENYNKLAKYHFMVFPTYWKDEGCPGIVIDSAIAGVPIIASDWNMNSKVIHHNETGIIVPTHDIDALYSAMKDIIDRKIDIELFSKNCQKYISSYRADTIINQVFSNK